MLFNSLTHNPLLSNKLYTPGTRPDLVRRPRLIERLNEGLARNLMLISAPTGFGRTTLVSEWLGRIEQPAAWPSQDEGDNEPARLMTYFVAASPVFGRRNGMWAVLTWSITHCSPPSAFSDETGRTVADMLESPQAAPDFETLMTILLNDIVALPTQLALVIDNYHVITATAIHNLLSLVLNNLPVPYTFFSKSAVKKRLGLLGFETRAAWK